MSVVFKVCEHEYMNDPPSIIVLRTALHNDKGLVYLLKNTTNYYYDMR